VTLVVLAVLGAITVGGVVVYLVTTSIRTPPPRELLPSAPEYRNHQGMARWIDRRLDDELVRPLLGEDVQTEGRSLS
jgi:hypothetical protein